MAKLEQSPVIDGDLGDIPDSPPDPAIKNLPAAWLDGVILVLLAVACLTYVASGTYNPFIYFRF